jgi:hypothetical protein
VTDTGCGTDIVRRMRAASPVAQTSMRSFSSRMTRPPLPARAKIAVLTCTKLRPPAVVSSTASVWR